MCTIKKLLSFLAIFASVIGAVGSFGYTVMCGQYLISVSVLVLAALAYPTVYKLFMFLIG